jgi:integrase
MAALSNAAALPRMMELQTKTGLTTAEQCTAFPLAPDGETRKLNDGNGLFLLATDAAKGWRFRYKNAAGKDALLSLGVFPAVSLDDARNAAADYRSKLKRGEALTDVRRKERSDTDLQARTFGEAAAEYNARREAAGDAAAKTLERCRLMFRHSGRLHRRTFAEIARPDILAVCQALESAGNRDSAKRLGVWITAVFRFAFDQGYAPKDMTDPTHQGGTIGKSLLPVREEHRAGLTDPKAVGALMRVVDGSEWLITPAVSRALQLQARTVVRPGNIRFAAWGEFDLDGSWPAHDGHPTWVIPLSKMKSRDGNRTDHVVPLSTQAVAILKRQKELTGHLQWVFPGARSDSVPMSDAAMSAALISFGYQDQHTAHGFRTTFRTLASDMLKVESELLECQLAHRVGSEVARAYDRSQRLEERRVLMQRYADLLDTLRADDTGQAAWLRHG